MENRDTLLYVTFGFVVLFWLLAYVLIVRRGFMEKTFGMPIVAMMGNWTWEWIYGLGLDSSCPPVWDACPERWFQFSDFAAAFFDLFIVYTIFKFGRDKVSNPFFRKYYYQVLVFGVIAAFAIQYPFVIEVGFPNTHSLAVRGEINPFFTGDSGGAYSGFILAFIMGILFIQMLTERNSLEGQSFIIALAMLMGNIASYIFVLIAQTGSRFLDVLACFTLFVNLVYVLLTYRKSVELGINPWTRW
ncbi:MAG TPA: hypothetical protein VJ821_10960 [Anaerolineales bacterium]|nr:hypothetical protein [Anaerolineales bacterium]